MSFDLRNINNLTGFKNVWIFAFLARFEFRAENEVNMELNLRFFETKSEIRSKKKELCIRILCLIESILWVKIIMSQIFILKILANIFSYPSATVRNMQAVINLLNDNNKNTRQCSKLKPLSVIVTMWTLCLMNNWKTIRKQSLVKV